MSERKLASIQIVSDIKPIPDADQIEVATINSWKLVVKKGEFKIGDTAIYCEIDSFLPITEQFEFLRKSSYKKMGDQEGFRLKTIRLRGQLSQGLLIPLSMLGEKANDFKVGDDVSEQLGIIKYEPPIPAQLAGVMRGGFPSFLRKTDEERVQNLTEEYEGYKSHKFYVTEKLDGTSATFYYYDGYFGVCSRNLDLLETPDNTLWKVARELDLENKFKLCGDYSNGGFAFQGELIGEGIQGNPYKIKGQTVRFFNIFDIYHNVYFRYESFITVLNTLGLTPVPVLNENYTLPETIDELLLTADGKSILNPQADREGIVVRSYDRSISFKAISNKFLLKAK